MSLFCIADLHLSLGTNKPMDVFEGWQDYTSRLLNNWNSIVKDEDTVVVAGDISWAMKLNECYKDFSFINNNLKGNKILLKGNHDYWWGTKKKINDYLIKMNLIK
jgi:predicted phosphohydrolase